MNYFKHTAVTQIAFEPAYMPTVERDALSRQVARSWSGHCKCRYLHDERLRREVQVGLNVVENWNSANSFIVNPYGAFQLDMTTRLSIAEVFTSV